MGGLKGKLGTWRWDAAYSHGENRLDRQQNNDIDFSKVQQALNAVDANTCVDPTGGCSPINLFDPSIPITPAALDFIRLNLQVQSLTTQDYVTANLGGDIGRILSWTQTPAAVSIGVEYRRETADFKPDAASASGVSPGFGQSLSVAGHYDVKEAFAEALIPVIEGINGIDFINLELGYRVSDYSSTGQVSTYKYGGEWQPMSGLRFRTMFQRAVRAPNLAEMFTPLTPGVGNLTVDPCALTVLASGPLFDLCFGTGAPTSRLNAGTVTGPISGQVGNFSGGNALLEPESSDTLTVGFVLEPDAIKNFTLSLDYYDIKIEKAVGVRPISDILEGCYNTARNTTASPTAADCLLVHRNPLDGGLNGNLTVGVNQSFQNISNVETRGLDLGANWVFPLANLGLGDEWGSLELAFSGTHIVTVDYQPTPTAAVIQCTGKFGQSCGLPNTYSASVGGPEPDYRWVERTTWSVGPVDVSARWRHISGVRLDELTPNILPAFSRIKAFDYVDFALQWTVRKGVRMNADVTNIFDRNPPVIGSATGSTTFNSGNTYPATYDTLGRVMTFGVSASF